MELVWPSAGASTRKRTANDKSHTTFPVDLANNANAGASLHPVRRVELAKRDATTLLSSPLHGPHLRKHRVSSLKKLYKQDPLRHLQSFPLGKRALCRAV